MRLLFLLALSFATLIVVSGCASDFGAMKTGTQVSSEQMASLVDRKSTQAEVIATIGQPSRKMQVGSTTIWYYDFSQIGQAYIGKNINESAVFEFNNKGILNAHYKTNNGKTGTSSNALLKAAGQ